MATQGVSGIENPQSSAWGELILRPRRPYYSLQKQRQTNWNALGSGDVVTVCEDPKHWKSLAARSMRGEKLAYGQLLTDFSAGLELFFSRILSDDEALIAVDDTLRSIARKFHTCDPTRPILPWLLAIARRRAEHPTKPILQD
jgi:hypothetical protein